MAPRCSPSFIGQFRLTRFQGYTRALTIYIYGFSIPLAQANERLLILATALVLLTLTACGKKQVGQAVPTPPPPAPPVASIEANPAMVQAGQPATVTWKTQNATEVRIEPLGVVEPNGSKTLTPTESTSYRLIATGPGGTRESLARITVTAAASSTGPTTDQLFTQESARQDVFFDLDQYLIRPDQQGTILKDARFLNDHPDLHVVIEGHCDELGSTDYNLALGDIRAHEVKEALVKAGVDAARIDTVTYGKERPFCNQSNEDCWKQNRRAHIVPTVER